MTLFFGLTLPFRAFLLILRSPVLALWSIAPISIAFALEWFVILKMQNWIQARIFEYLGTSGFLAPLALILSWLTILTVSALTFSFVAAVVATPFNDFLAEKTESRSNPPLARVNIGSCSIRARLLIQDLRKSLAAASLGLAALFISWVPGLNAVAFVIGCWLISFQFLSYPQTRRGEGILEGLRFIGRNPLACLGFGATCSALFAVPILSALALPLAVVGGTLLYARGSASRSPR